MIAQVIKLPQAVQNTGLARGQRMVGSALSRKARALVAVMLAGAALAGAALAPVALAGANAAGAAGTPSTSIAPYPPPICASIGLSTSTVRPGGSVEVTGTGFRHYANVEILITEGSRTWVLAHVITSATGTFDHTVTIPVGVTGTVTVSTSGGTPAGCTIEPILITTGPGSGGGPPASTGVDVEAMVILGGVLLAIGVPLAMTRRHRPRPVHLWCRGSGAAIALAPYRPWDAT